MSMWSATAIAVSVADEDAVDRVESLCLRVHALLKLVKAALHSARSLLTLVDVAFDMRLEPLGEVVQLHLDALDPPDLLRAVEKIAEVAGGEAQCAGERENRREEHSSHDESPVAVSSDGVHRSSSQVFSQRQQNGMFDSLDVHPRPEVTVKNELCTQHVERGQHAPRTADRLRAADGVE